ncbi:MAG: efflux RND transporter permease subunit [Pseudomonadota bacterium]|nr:efflux RND transporter permease subunit [Pseudomonadota bacterium]
MNLPRFALTHRSVVLAFVGVLFASGLFNFADMSRREDPEITIRDALVLTRWPGAPAARVEELLTDPLEKAIAGIAEVETIRSKSLVGLSIIQVTADDAVTDTDQVWDDVRAKVEPVRPRLPNGAGAPWVNSDFGNVYEIVLALHQTPVPGQEAIEHPYSPRQLEVLAERIEDELELVDPVARVDLWGVQPERIYVEVDSADWARLALGAGRLRELFEARNILHPGGEMDTARGRYAVDPTGEFTSVRQMGDLIVDRLDGGLPVRLGDLPVRIDRRYEEPPGSLTRVTTPDAPHRDALVIGISMKSGRNVVDMSEAVDVVLARLEDSFLPPDVRLRRVNDLPRQVNTRIQSFQINLLQGVLIVLGMALLTMGWRPALIMATAVPLSMICAFAVVRHLGVELEQFSIASLIIALGMVVDNAIVVSDNAWRLMREGLPRREAIIKGAQDLAIPLLTATLTTVFAFLPMLTIAGNVGEYVSSLPVVVAATLITSYLVAMLVTPLMCGWLLKPPPEVNAETDAGTRMAPAHYDRLIGWCLDHKGAVLGGAGALFLASLALLPIIGNQFFPAGLRDQFFIKVWLPEGAPIAATSGIARDVERILLESSPMTEDGTTRERLASVVSFVGTGGPRLMLTQEPEYDYPYLAFLLVNTTDPEVTEAYAREVREKLSGIHQARISVDEFMLGPPIKDPIAFRLSGPDAGVLRESAREMVKVFKQTPGTVEPYSNWGTTGYQVEVRIDPYAANLAGVTNEDVALTTRAMLSGAYLTTYREGDHQIPVLLRTLREKRRDPNDLSGIFVNGRYGKVPLNAIAELAPDWEPAIIARRDSLPTVTVGARVEEGLLANSVANRIKPALEEILQGLPAGYFLSQGGEYEETAKAQTQVVRAVGLAMVLIVIVLVTQYNSFLKPLVILFTVPLALIGVLAGLFVTGWAMGFMAMLGVLSLIGIVINNAIVLIDFIQVRVAEGQPLREAVAAAGRVRIRPIVLTSLTTIGGLLPLSLFGGALWAPMTNGMIFGLIFSTALTLIVVPTLYVLFVERFHMRVLPRER